MACVRLSIPLFALLTLTGCGVFRGIPSHGGGKRFDEEQRVVAGAIRQTVADMDLVELRGKKVAISLECISQDGGGNVVFPGISSINGNVGGNVGSNDFVQIVPSGDGTAKLKNNSDNNGMSGGIGVNYNAMTLLSSHAYSTMPDLQYLRAALEMKVRHAGLQLVNADPEFVLYVLVDVLGTNRSRTDNFFSNSDKLLASCEATYYAQDLKTGTLVFGARRASSCSMYRETRALGIKGAVVDRQTERVAPTPLPVDETAPPSTQPVLARKKQWYEQMLTQMTGE